MMTAAQVQAVKRNLLAAQISYRRSELNEESLYVELHNFFQHLKETVLHELHEYWVDDDTILLEGQLDLILSPIFESQQEYYNILRKHNIKEYNFGCKEASRLVKLAKKQVSSYKSESNTIKVNKLANLNVDKDELFGTNDWTEQRLLNQSFTASENTMNRVDQDINKIVSDGYKSGDGVNKVAANIETRFEQLKTWESKRIARTEMHNAHQMGIMNTYQEMGVQYTQWSAAHDSRTRDSHLEIDGEIIPLGGTYSNDLQYPGDTNGPISEWINCRCGNVPYIMPDGYIAPPGMAQFRESDLIQTLDYWNQDELITKATQEANSQLYSENYGVPLDHSLSKAKFAVPTEDLSEFEITDKGLEIIQGFQKKRFGSTREYGLAFNEKTGKIFSNTEFRGVENDVIILKPNKNHSTIHYHTEDGFNPLSHGDFNSYLRNSKEQVGINVSKKETWLIKQEREFDLDEIEEITENIKKLEKKQLQKMKSEFDKEMLRINKIKDSKLKKIENEKFHVYLNNDFLDNHNNELGNNILEYTSKIKGLKVKRVMNTLIERKSITSLPKLKVDKKYDMYVGNEKYSTPINSQKDNNLLKKVKIDSKIKNNKKVKVDSIESYTSYSDNAKEKIDSYVKSQNLKNKNKSKLAIWSGTGAKSIKAFQLNDMNAIRKEFKKKGHFFNNIHDVSRITYQIKRIINKRRNELGENLIVYKGIKSEDMDLSKFVVGEVNKFDTHMSTTLNLNTAKKFAKDLNDEGYIVVMYTHKKVKGAAINGSFNKSPEEYEILLSESQSYITSHIDENIIFIFVG